MNLHKGPAGLLDEVEEDLVAFVDEWRLKGLPVSHLSLVRKACQLSPAFAEKSLAAQKMAVSCVMVRNNLALHVDACRAAPTQRGDAGSPRLPAGDDSHHKRWESFTRVHPQHGSDPHVARNDTEGVDRHRRHAHD